MRATVSATWQHHTALIDELRALGRSRLRTTDTASARVPRKRGLRGDTRSPSSRGISASWRQTCVAADARRSR
jgi:hypothetical protein